MKTWFQNVPFKCNLHRYNLADISVFGVLRAVKTFETSAVGAPAHVDSPRPIAAHS